MKKIIVSVVIVLLLVIVFFQYKKYTRLNAPHSYEYKISESVDVNYFDPSVVKDYYELSYDIGSFAREQWHNHNIDVLYKDNATELSKRATLTYNKMRAAAKELEAKLEGSAALKAKGYSNSDIKTIYEKGLSIQDFEIYKIYGETLLQFGDEDKGVLFMQEKLNEKGFPIRIDGIYNLETKGAVMEFQNKNKLFPSGIADKYTLQLLFENKK